jgi:GMP synthase PP-ATPase subunit
MAPKREAIQGDLRSLGGLVSVTLVDRSDFKPAYWYRLEFKSKKLLQRFVFDEQNRVADVQVEESDPK